MKFNEMMFEEACKAYGECIGTNGCYAESVNKMIDMFDLDEKDAKELVDAAYAEWMEAYE